MPTTTTRVESPAQIVSPHRWRDLLQTDYALNDPARVLYLAPDGATTLGPAVIVEPFPIDELLELSRTARAELRGDEHHRRVCGRGALAVWERASCGTCALLGWRDEHDDEVPTDRPNHGAWPLIYIAARAAIPRAWLPALVEDLNDDDNERYRDNLRRHVATYGYRVTDERPGYRLVTPTAESVRAYVAETEPDDIAAALQAIAADADDDYDTATRRAAATARGL